MAKVTIDSNRCKSCGLCVSFCPKTILGLSKTQTNSAGYHPAEVLDPDACIGCASCATVCPDMCIEIVR